MRHRRLTYHKHNQQTEHTRSRLQAAWSPNRTLLGEVRLWDLLQLLHFTIDHSDPYLRYTSQFTHCLQARRRAARCRGPPRLCISSQAVS